MAAIVSFLFVGDTSVFVSGALLSATAAGLFFCRQRIFPRAERDRSPGAW